LVSCSAASAPAIVESIKAAGFPSASIIGRTEAGAPKITVV
jgi:hypothetical protein